MNRERKLELRTIDFFWTQSQKHYMKKSKGKASPSESLQQVLIKVSVLALTSATAFTIYMVESTTPT